MPQINGGFSFDAGIEQILIQDDASPPSLPEGTRTLPGDGQILRRLDEVLSPRSVDQALLESLRPKIAARDILTPQGYKESRLQTAEDLNEFKTTTSDAAQRNAIDRTLELLNDVNAHHDLVDTNLMALRPG